MSLIDAIRGGVSPNQYIANLQRDIGAQNEYQAANEASKIAMEGVREAALAGDPIAQKQLNESAGLFSGGGTAQQLTNRAAGLRRLGSDFARNQMNKEILSGDTDALFDRNGNKIVPTDGGYAIAPKDYIEGDMIKGQVGKTIQDLLPLFGSNVSPVIDKLLTKENLFEDRQKNRYARDTALAETANKRRLAEMILRENLARTRPGRAGNKSGADFGLKEQSVMISKLMKDGRMSFDDAVSAVEQFKNKGNFEKDNKRIRLIEPEEPEETKGIKTSKNDNNLFDEPFQDPWENTKTVGDTLRAAVSTPGYVLAEGGRQLSNAVSDILDSPINTNKVDARTLESSRLKQALQSGVLDLEQRAGVIRRLAELQAGSGVASGRN